jgi:hypothetical protein
MLVRSLCKHYDKQFHEEGEEWEHSGPLYEHIVPADPDKPQKGEPASRAMKPAKA